MKKDSDPVLKEGNLLSNVLNRAVRSSFYTAQKYTDGKIPVGTVSEEVISESNKAILEYERLMHKVELHQVMNVMDTYIRFINKYWSKHIRKADANNDDNLRKQVLIDAFHMIKTSIVLMHPIAPNGTQLVCDYLNLDTEIWSWDNIFEPIYSFMNIPEEHQLKFLEPKFDFFPKHPSQLVFD